MCLDNWVFRSHYLPGITNTEFHSCLTSKRSRGHYRLVLFEVCKFNIQSRPISLLIFLVVNIQGSLFNPFLFYVGLTCASLEERGRLTVAHLMKLGKDSAFRYHFKKSCVMKADPPYQGKRIYTYHHKSV